jgi:hypothetical protein
VDKQNKNGGKKMTKHLQKVKISLLIGIFLLSILNFSAISPLSSISSARNNYIISYPSVISIDIDPASLEALNKPINIDTSLLVKLKIGYSVGVPAALLTGGLLNNLIVFGSTVQFPQMIHLEIQGKPDWADIALLTPDIYIQNYSNSPEYAYADVVITPYYDAPAVPKSITVKADAPAKGRIQEVSFTTRLNFQPEFIPQISVEVDQPVRNAGPRTAVNYQIKITNMGNKEAIVKGVIENAPAEWAALLTPSQLPIGPGQEATMTFSITTPYSFGWHDDLRTFSISLTPERAPPTVPAITGTPNIVQVSINSVGFAIPGFEPILLFAGLAILLSIMKIRKKK